MTSSGKLNMRIKFNNENFKSNESFTLTPVYFAEGSKQFLIYLLMRLKFREGTVIDL